MLVGWWSLISSMRRLANETYSVRVCLTWVTRADSLYLILPLVHALECLSLSFPKPKKPIPVTLNILKHSKSKIIADSVSSYLIFAQFIDIIAYFWHALLTFICSTLRSWVRIDLHIHCACCMCCKLTCTCTYYTSNLCIFMWILDCIWIWSVNLQYMCVLHVILIYLYLGTSIQRLYMYSVVVHGLRLPCDLNVLCTTKCIHFTCKCTCRCMASFREYLEHFAGSQDVVLAARPLKQLEPHFLRHCPAYTSLSPDDRQSVSFSLH